MYEKPVNIFENLLNALEADVSSSSYCCIMKLVELGDLLPGEDNADALPHELVRV